MIFYNYSEHESNHGLAACWNSDKSAVVAELNRNRLHDNLTLIAKSVPEFSGAPSLESFSHWTYTAGDYPGFQLCLNRQLFDIHSRGVIAEIQMDGTYFLTPLAYYGLFNSTVAVPSSAQKANTLEEATHAVERDVLMVIRRIKQQLHLVDPESYQDVFI